MTSLPDAQKALLLYGLAMGLAMIPTYLWSWFDSRTIRAVGIWVKPMKFMAATALFALTTVWLMRLCGTSIETNSQFNWIAALIVCTSSFEVAYITFQAISGLQSHYNTSDLFHSVMVSIMGIAAVGLTASQAWLAWVIWDHRNLSTISVIHLGVVTGLVSTFLLATISGFLLGSNQPPPGKGIPIVGWQLHNDIRPSHFLGVHAQQFIPIFALLADRIFGASAYVVFAILTVLYIITWIGLTWVGLKWKLPYKPAHTSNKVLST